MPGRLPSVLLAGVLLAGLPAMAAAGGAAPRRSVVLALAAPAAEVLPSAATRSAAAAAAGALGLRVDGGDAASLTVSGPAVRVADLFPRSDFRLGATLATPVALRATVELVIDPADRTPVAHGHITAVSDLAAAYGGPAPGAAGRTRPALTARTPVIASLQLAGWEPELLTRYAHDQVFTADPSYDPVAAGQYTAVPVDRPERWGGAADTDGSGQLDDEADAEVALDQEALLAAAPEVKQRAYFATNSSKGYLAALDRLLADVDAGLPIVAFTTSWGSCEAVYGGGYLLRVDAVLRRLSALGVTVFAASGDDGLTDCLRSGRGGRAVDYPASSPYAVGVGGTRHDNGSAPPAPDRAWVVQPSAERVGAAGSGGGSSAVFAAPSWQAPLGGSRRRVPDLALAADSSSGVQIETNDHSGGRLRLQTPVVGGTSLASPLAAALVTNYLAGRGFGGGRVHGLGDVHRAMYAAASTLGAFVDVVATGQPNSPQVIATPGVGYDEATGLGTPNLAVLGPLLSAGATAPRSPGPPSVRVPPLSTGRVALQLAAPTGTVGYFVSVGHDAGCMGGLTKARTSVAAREGVSTVYVRALSSALTCSSARTGTLVVGTDDGKARRTPGWASRGSAAAFAGTFSSAGRPGAQLEWTLTGQRFRVLLDTFSRGGDAQLLVDGRVVRTVATRGRDRWAVPLAVAAPTGGRHTVSVRVVGDGEVRADGIVRLG